ncbi:GumC family protein [Chelativorans intermedius]|uniref:GumC family protein n=1 Tax=Chelativorans intermedius TaxID=515947 RepID=A0ABV6D4Z2_9HYPH|nr:Wzz/FepE/Etk N-terminal domain-containing protein [Chelativorans intermedius]MCT8999059.1 Wzz/FepE/Etk N-terminal domain-containing protein [Chelativorans intermedius]
MSSDIRKAGDLDVDVDLAHLFASLRRRWRRIAVFAFAMTAIAFLIAVTATPLYRAETRLLIEMRESVYTRPQLAEAGERAALDSEGVASQAEIISSTEILTQVARELDLASREEFEAAGPSLPGRLLIALGLKSDPAATPPEERVLEAFREKLQVYRVENSRVIVIRFSSEDPELAARVPNAIADAYVASQRAAKAQSNEDATEWLEPEIADLRQRVREAEERVAAFRARSDLLIGQNNTVLATQQLAELSSELSRVRAGRAAAEAKAQAVRTAIERGTALDTLPDVLASGLIQRLREQQVELRAQIADLSTALLSSHPRIRALQSRLADLNAQIRAETVKVLEGLEQEAQTARLRERELMADLATLKAESARAEEEQVELRALEREATAQRELLESYLTRYREAAARGERNYLPVDARIFSRAIAPAEPYFPKVLPITLAAFAGSLLVMGVVVLLQELFSGRALRPAAATFTPVEQVEMPPARAQEAAPGRGAPPDEVNVEAAAEALISTGVARAIFISPEGDEAAATAVLVAREVADAGLRVLLLDLTATGAASWPTLESDVYPGITNLLAAEARFSDVIHGDLYSACHVIPIGTADPARAMRGIDRLPIIMSSLTTAYDLVVVECGAAEATALARIVDEDARLLVSVLDPKDGAVATTAETLRAAGLGTPLLVSPAGRIPPPAPPGRDVA